MTDWLTVPLLGNPLTDWLRALGIALAINLLVALLKRAAVRRLQDLSSRTPTHVDDALVAAIRGTRQWLVFFVALYLASQGLELRPRAEKLVAGVAIVAAFLQLGLWLSLAIAAWLARSRARALAGNASAATSLAAMGFIAQTLIWTLVVLLILDNLGINITALVAGLGIGGVAIALAVQNILGDLFASLSIVIDKPFVIGDFIVVDDYMGTVEYVGLKTTRVRSLGGEQIIFANGDLLKARTRNYKRMIERRVVFSFSVDRVTPPERLAALPDALRGIIEAQAQVRFERAHFQKFGTTSLDFEVVYWMLTDDYNRYMDVQQAINLALMHELSAAGISLALPTQRLLLQPPPTATLPEQESATGSAQSSSSSPNSSFKPAPAR